MAIILPQKGVDDGTGPRNLERMQVKTRLVRNAARALWRAVWIGSFMAASTTSAFVLEENIFGAQLSLTPHAPLQSVTPIEDDQLTPFGDVQTARDNLGEIIDRVRRLMARGDYALALSEVRVELGLYGEAPVLLWLGARINLLAGDLAQAETYWARLAAVEAENFEVLTGWGATLLRLGQAGQAEEALLRSNELQPYFPHTLFHLMCLYLHTDRPDQATALTRQLNAPDLAQFAQWMDQEYDYLVEAFGEAVYARLGRMIFSGGEEAPVAAPATAVPSGALAFSPSGEAVGALFGQGGDGDESSAAEEMRRRLLWLFGFLQRYGETIQAERWAEAARIGQRPELRARNLTAPAFKAFVAYARLRAGDEGGRSALETLAKDYPNSLHAGLRWATAQLETDQYSEAAETLARLGVDHPRHPLRQILLACARAGNGEHEAALTVLRSIDPKSYPFIARWLESAAPYQEAIRTHPAYAEWRSDLFR